MNVRIPMLAFATVVTLAGPAAAVTFEIKAEAGANEAAQLAFNSAVDGDVIEFGAGVFHLSQTLAMSFVNDIRIEGAGRDETVLSFATSQTPEGLDLSHMKGVTIRNLTVIDTPGFSIKVSDSQFVKLKRVRAMWSSADGRTNPADPSTLRVGCTPNLATIGHPRTDQLLDASLGKLLDLVTGLIPLDGIVPSSQDLFGPARGPGRVLTPDYVPSSSNGGYAIYPVLSSDVLIEEVEAIGASDAGIYVGQSNDVIVKNSRAAYNVAGYEIENTDNADMFDNLAECNTGGFLIFDLPGLNQYGDRTRMFGNVSRYNNLVNFAPGGVVTGIPAGTGSLILGYDHIEIFDNVIEHHRTAGLVIASHELVEGSPQNVGDRRMDLYTDSVHVHDNVFTNSGYAPQEPEAGVLQFDPETGLPSGIDDGHDSLLPALIMAKGLLSNGSSDHVSLPRGAHVVWDGMFDRAPYTFGDSLKEGEFPPGTDASTPCDLSNYLPPGADPDILDEHGKPQYTGVHYPVCRYNAYKFDASGNRHPLWSHCYENNTFSPESETYMNFRDTDPTSPASFDIEEHSECIVDGEPRKPLPAAVVESYESGSGGGSGPTPEEIAQACEGFTGPGVNWGALEYDCPKLSHFNLFTDPTDPTKNPHGARTVLFDLNTPLFSDYARKYRFLFLPDGAKVGWRDDDGSMPNETLHFPVGTIFAKTFAFPDGAEEDVVETRLLVHRPDTDGGDGTWRGLVYLWEKDANGDLVEANLLLSGTTASVTWDYDDPDPEVGKHYAGSTTRYAVPTVNQCKSCHANDDRPAGAAPIGPKVRNLNRPMDYGSGPESQLQKWVDLGILENAPALTVAGGVATNVPRIPRFDVPSDPGHGLPPAFVAHAGPGEEGIQARARSWLETNCAHCHNQKGAARNSGLFLDVFREVDFSHGICKVPTAAGRGSGGRPYDIVPGDPGDSILTFRIESTDPGEQMPTIARSVRHEEAIDLVTQWIRDVVHAGYPDASCAN